MIKEAGRGKDAEVRLNILAFIVVLMFLWTIGLIFCNVHLMDQMEELKLRHEQLEEGFADFLDEYYQVELIWPDDFQFVGRFGHERLI